MKIQCFLLLLAVVVVDLVTASKAITPVVFLPGYFGSQLIVTIDNEAIIPASCQVEGLNVPVGLPFAAMFNVTLLAKAPNCIFDLLATDMNCGDNSACVFSSKAGISVSSNDFGGFRGVEPVYWSFPRLLESWGYKLGVNLFGAPYDYRFMSVKSIIASGLVQALMDLVEKAYHLSGGKKVVLMGHSNGGPTLYSFFSASAADSTLMTLQWKDKYVAAMIGLSGNFLGQMNGYKAFTYTEAAAEQAMSSSWEAAYGTTPWGNYSALQGMPMITTFNATSPVTYTPSLQDTYDMLVEAHKQDWASRLLAVNGYAVSSVHESSASEPHNAGAAPPSTSVSDLKQLIKVGPGLDRTAHPLVDTYCLYGTNVSTTYGFVFSQNILEAEAVETLYMEGDGNQDIIDNRFCNVWASDTTAQQLGYVFEASEFPNVRHMQMYSDDNVMQKVREILEKYN